MSGEPKLIHQARWNEPVVMELGVPGRRGIVFPKPAVDAGALVPAGMRRRSAPALPEMTEHDVLRHYLHLSQQVLGMMGVSLFGTCTMKYNPRLSEALGIRPQMAEIHPLQDESTIQGLLEIVHRFDLILRELSGMDQFVFQAGLANSAGSTVCRKVVMSAWVMLATAGAFWAKPK